MFNRSMNTKKICTVVLLAATVLCLSGTANGGLRGPGKYNGVVVFDRWDGCYLCSGLYLMCVPEHLKETVRPYMGRSVILDATKVFQPINPGDGRLEQFAFSGYSCPDNPEDMTRQIELVASVSLEDSSHPKFHLLARNRGLKPLWFDGHELALTILAQNLEGTGKEAMRFEPSDGPSYPLITRWSAGHEGRQHGQDQQQVTWTASKQDWASARYEFAPGETREFTFSADFTGGKYDLFFGYGGGVLASESVTSNQIFVDVSPSGQTSQPTENRGK